MNALKNIALMLLILTLACCKSKDEPAPQSAAVFTVINTYPVSPGVEYGLLFHSKDGTSLGWKKYDAGDTVRFPVSQATLDEGLTVTSYAVHDGVTGARVWFISTFVAAPANDTWRIKPSVPKTPDLGDVAGSCTVKVTGYDPNSMPTLTNKLGQPSSGTWTPEISTFNHIIAVKSPYSFLFATKNNVPRYKRFPTPQANSTTTIDYNDLLPFEKVVKMATPKMASATGIKIVSHDDDEFLNYAGPIHQYYNDAVPVDTIRLYYASGYYRYMTEFSLGYPDFDYQYMKRGAASDGIQLPQTADFITTNKTFLNYEVSGSKTFVSRVTNFEHSSDAQVISWKVYSAATAVPFTELPSDFVSAHPDIKLAELEATTGYFYLQGWTMPHLIAKAYKGEYLPIEEMACEIIR